MDEDEAAFQEWYDRKSAQMARVLGPEHDVVMHAVIPYVLGGSLDLYYYPHGIPGTAVATKELTERSGEGSSNSVFECYELVMFTKQRLDLDVAHDATTPFGRAHRAINSILNCIAPYSSEATLEPNETCEFPADMAEIGGRCVVFDGYPTYSSDDPAEFGLLAVIEVFRSEMEYARREGSAKLIARLKAEGYYPYSDLDRQPVA